MPTNALLSRTSLLVIVLLTLHLTDDVVLGKDVLDVARLSIYLPVLAAWLYGTLVLTERRAGRGIMLLGSLLGLLVVALHASGPTGIHGTFSHVWLLLAIGSAAAFLLMLALHAALATRGSH